MPRKIHAKPDTITINEVDASALRARQNAIGDFEVVVEGLLARLWHKYWHCATEFE